MSEKNSFPFDIPELPDSVDNALKNLSDAPTKSIGQTLSDAWFLVFGGISHQANKRRMKYAHDLEIYNYELSQAIANVPPENLIEPDIQTTAQALENSKYCIESEELRKMFVNLISNSMNSDYVQKVHPSFAEIIKQMSPVDARIFKSLGSKIGFPLVDYILQDQRNNKYELRLSTVYLTSVSEISIEAASSSISSLNRLGLIEIDYQAPLASSAVYQPYEETSFYRQLSIKAFASYPNKRASIRKYSRRITPLGKNFFEVCVK